MVLLPRLRLMIVVIRTGISQAELRPAVCKLEALGFDVRTIPTREKVMLEAHPTTATNEHACASQMRAFGFVEEVLVDGKPFRAVSSIEAGVAVGNLTLGGKEVIIMAGPCTVESEEQLFAAAEAVASAGATVLRGGAYKPSTSPYGFQGLGQEGLELLAAAASRYHLKVVTEVMDPRKVELVARYASILQIGTRNMQNYDLLKEVGRSKTPVLLKRGMSARIEEWLLAAEYILNEGNPHVILCERGIRTFETATRNTLDIAAVPVVKAQTGLPVVVDPSQGTGRRDLVRPMSLAAIAAGADGLLIEVHPNPEAAIKDGAQSLSATEFVSLMADARRVAEAVGRVVAGSERFVNSR